MRYTLIISLFLLASCVKYSRDPIENVDLKVDVEQTLEYLQDLESEYQEEPQLYYHLAKAYAAKENYAAANNQIDKAISLAEDRAEYFYEKGKIEKKLNHHAESVSALLTAEAMGVQNFHLYKDLAEEYMALGDAEKAKSSVNRLTEMESSGDGYRLKGDIMLALEDTASAIDNYTKAIAMTPSQMGAHVGLFDIYSRRKEYNKADEQINQLLALSPRNNDYIEKKADIMNDMGRLDTAKVLYIDLVESRGSLKDYYKLADAFYQLSDYDSAQLMAQEAYAIDTNYLEAKLIVARTLDKQRKYQDAIGAYEQILQRDSTFNLAQAELEVLQRKVAYLWRLQQEKASLDAIRNGPPPAVKKKDITIEK
ncbi:tetratricopeptide repeat protein [Fulvivirga ligni]|uniref:tetratricopeptide repeat protein n=1 Tax=Fulvivirga ligni TaxID=2904246 RepID=UPI001F3B4396|nr:tetratricopeptide repeat protein [Fulvivirga ligni]UII19070.1 tetratricopeptide repeat protein [Fulvivirga ligni]